MTFDGHQLAAFLAIVERGSLGRAAEALHVTQPALSRTIKRLEAEVGAPLFERHTKGMALTPVGSALLPHAQSLQRGAEQATEELNAMRGLTKGTIKVGAVGSVASRVLPQAISRVLARSPQLRVLVIEGVWDRLAQGLMKHEIDLALGVLVQESEDICSVPECRWDDETDVVASPHHPLMSRANVTLADTVDQQWAIPPRGTGPFEHMRDAFARNGLPMPEIAVETRSIVTLKGLVVRGGCLSWMSEPMYDAERQSGLIGALPIVGLSAPRTLTAFRRRQGLLPAPAIRLLEELRQVAMYPG